MKKISLCALLFALCALLASCGEKKTDTAAPKSVRVRVVETDSVSIPLRIPAQIQGREDIAIVPQITATLEQVLVNEGDRVTAGQPLFLLARTSYQAAVDNAAADVAAAQVQVDTEQLELNAKRKLLDKNIISEHEFRVQENRLRAAEASLQKAKASLTHAQSDLGHTVITAPHTGVVGSIRYKQGSLVGPSITEPMTIVSDNSVVYAYLSVAGDEYLYLVSLYGSKEKMIARIPPFTLILGNDTRYPHEGRLETVSGIIDRSTGAVSMRVAFPNPDRILTAGGSGVVEVCENRPNAIVLPRTAVFGIQDKNYVCVVEADTVRQAMVGVERLDDTRYIISEGLVAGQAVVLEGVKKLTAGEHVTPVAE